MYLCLSPLTAIIFHEWTQDYGSIVGLKLGPQNVVILNSYKHVKEYVEACDQGHDLKLT